MSSSCNLQIENSNNNFARAAAEEMGRVASLYSTSLRNSSSYQVQYVHVCRAGTFKKPRRSQEGSPFSVIVQIYLFVHEYNAYSKDINSPSVDSGSTLYAVSYTSQSYVLPPQVTDAKRNKEQSTSCNPAYSITPRSHGIASSYCSKAQVVLRL